MVAKLEAAIADVEADLEKARAAGNDKKIKELEENLASRQSFLDMAKRDELGDFSADWPLVGRSSAPPALRGARRSSARRCLGAAQTARAEVAGLARRRRRRAT